MWRRQTAKPFQPGYCANFPPLFRGIYQSRAVPPSLRQGLEDQGEFPRLLLDAAVVVAAFPRAFGMVAVAGPKTRAPHPIGFPRERHHLFGVLDRENFSLLIVLPYHWSDADSNRRIDGEGLLARRIGRGDGEVSHLSPARPVRAVIHGHDVGGFDFHPLRHSVLKQDER